MVVAVKVQDLKEADMIDGSDLKAGRWRKNVEMLKSNIAGKGCEAN
jgi:hypothetical protein